MTGDAFDEALARLCDEWLTGQRDRMGSKRPRIALHDPMTLACLVEPGLCEFESIRGTSDERRFGRETADGGEIELAVSCDPETVRAHLTWVWCQR